MSVTAQTSSATSSVLTSLLLVSDDTCMCVCVCVCVCVNVSERESGRCKFQPLQNFLHIIEGLGVVCYLLSCTTHFNTHCHCTCACVLSTKHSGDLHCCLCFVGDCIMTGVCMC